MFKPLELYIGLRYTGAKRRNHFISFISMSSMLGIALGVTALITVLSVMNGFERELRERILGMASHATISGVDGRLDGWRELIRKAGAAEQSLVLRLCARGSDAHQSQLVRGAWCEASCPSTETSVSEVSHYLKAGRLEDLRAGAFNIVLGAGWRAPLRARIGSKVTVVAPQANVSPAG